MKTKKDPRHKMRQQVIKSLFAESFTHQPERPDMAVRILKDQEELDKKIQLAATEWPIDKLNKIDHAILQLSVYELENTDTPPKVIIDEAVELAKEFGAENSPSFVNGVLGTILKEIGKEKSK